ncbi:hypothetical protein C7293_17470 [filamentous cyanobacterium CCT1]|nr:hypothetical protein C7293_17470 [filamentous cyanobacterium CCT1]
MNVFLRGVSRSQWRCVLFLSTLLLVIVLALPDSRMALSMASPAVSAEGIPLRELVQRGVDRFQEGNFQGAIQLWQSALTSIEGKDRAVVLENLARAYRYTGQTSTAVNYWQQVIDHHRRLGNSLALGRSLTEQAQAYSALGQHRRAMALLCRESGEVGTCAAQSAVSLAETEGDEAGRAAALGAFGEALRLRGEYEAAIAALGNSLTTAREANQLSYQISALTSLGTVYTGKAQILYRQAESATLNGDDARSIEDQAKAEDRQALEYFIQSQALANQQGDAMAEMRSQLSQVSIYYRLGEATQAQAAQEAALGLLAQTPNSHDTVFATITLANLVQFGGRGSSATAGCFAGVANSQTQALLTQAMRQAQSLGDSRGESFALGTLGHWYECQQNYGQALALTQQAEWIAGQQREGEDSRYLWEWQAGRIYRAQDKFVEAIQSYTQAVATLEAIRSDLLISDRELQFDFRDSVEPIYRELIALQLGSPDDPAAKGEPISVATANLGAALTTVDALRLAELQNYFGSDCELIPFAETPVGLVGADSATALFTSVILGDRTAIIVSFPDGSRQAAWIPVDEVTLRAAIRTFRQGLESWFDNFDPGLAQQVYDWLIRPFAQRLADAEIETLVFVNDGILRSVPMAALHDGQRFLVETYALATVPTLSLTAASASSDQPIRALVAGLSESITVDGQSFKPLPHVKGELDTIENTVPKATLLLDQAFTRQRLEQELTDNAYTVLHMATHGKFGVRPEDTFLVTGAGEKLTLADLEQFVSRMAAGNEVIDLLALTACETGIGDDRSALGLGGVAVRAGVKSAIATLWSIDDAKTAQLSAQFYQGLVSGQYTKAEALRTAQIELIQERVHPAYWAPFMLVGNWL